MKEKRKQKKTFKDYENFKKKSNFICLNGNTKKEKKERKMHLCLRKPFLEVLVTQTSWDGSAALGLSNSQGWVGWFIKTQRNSR